MLLELITSETTLVLPAALKQKSRLKNLQVASKLYRSVVNYDLLSWFINTPEEFMSK